MSAHTVSRGLDVPIAGAPSPVIHAAHDVSKVGLLPPDARGIRPRLLVQVGDTVQAGQPIYQDRRDERLRITTAVAGVVSAINRGDRRVIQSVTIDVAPGAAGSPAGSPFASWSASVGRDPAKLRALLLESGLWAAIRTRPFSEVPSPDATPHALFVTAMDTQPLAPSVDVIIAERSDDFARGLEALVALTDSPVYLCRAVGSRSGDGGKGVHVAEFAGKHPSGTVGYHIHTLAPVSREHVAWHLGAQDVIRFGALLRTGHLDATQIIAIGGPVVREPRLLRTVLGANVRELLRGELNAADSHGNGAPTAGHREHRIISGSVLTGRQVDDDITGYLGRFHQQVSVIPEGQAGEFIGWMLPASRSYTYLPVFLASWARKRERAFDTRLHGGRRAMVPIGLYEEVMPMDLMPTHLLRAISVGDAEWAESLGVLELDEEDVALCTFVCPSKYEYGAALRRVLDLIASER